MSDIARKLAEPFAPHIVSFRVGPTTKDKTKGMALAYIDARDVMRRLDEVCGPERWQDEYPWSDGRRVVCRIGIKIDRSGPDGGDDTEWVWKTDGAGDTDTEGEKGALSDAFKRAAVKWGVGRYLYDVEAPWVEIEQKGQSYAIKQSELARLRSRLPAPHGTTPPAAPQPQAPRAGMVRAADVPPQTAPPPKMANGNGKAPVEHPKRQEALDAYTHIAKHLKEAKTPAAIEELIKINAKDLALVKEVHAESYELLMRAANDFKAEMYGATG